MAFNAVRGSGTPAVRPPAQDQEAIATGWMPVASNEMKPKTGLVPLSAEE